MSDIVRTPFYKSSLFWFVVLLILFIMQILPHFAVHQQSS